jgi:hypothetical protein
VIKISQAGKWDNAKYSMTISIVRLMESSAGNRERDSSNWIDRARIKTSPRRAVGRAKIFVFVERDVTGIAIAGWL